MQKTFRKIHLWLSVPFGIIITLICFSGAMLVFEKEITEWCRPNLYFVDEVKERPIAMDSLLRKVSATLPDSVSITGVTVLPHEGSTYQVSLSKPRRATIFVDQYSGEVKGRNERLSFFDTMFHLHRWLLGPSQSADGGISVGKLLVGVSTIMLVIILVTGLLIWLTNRRKPLRKSLTISITKGWPRFWHDLHVAGGIYATIFLLAIALTGLTWSFSWYRTGFYSLFGAEGGSEHGAFHGGAGRQGGGNRGGGHGRHGNNGTEYHYGNRADSTRTEVATDENGPETRKERKIQTEKPAATETPKAEQTPKETPAEETAAVPNEEAPHRQHGHGGGGWHRHSQDSTGEYAGYHRRDSARSRRHYHDAETDGATEQAQTARETAPQRPQNGSEREATTHKRDGNGRGGRYGGERRGRGNDVKPAPQAADTARNAIADTMPAEPLPFAHWQEVYEKLAEMHPGYRQITIGDGTASVVPAGRNSLRSGDKFDFDPFTGKITGKSPYSDQDRSAKVRSAVYTVHVGSWGGLLTRVITFIAVLLGATLPLTGYYLWIRKWWMKKKHPGERK